MKQRPFRSADWQSAVSPAGSRPQHLTSDQILSDLLQFTRQKFYPDHPVQFAKDRSRLLQWVLLLPATWLQKKAVSLPPERYKSLVISVLMDAARFGTPSKATYFPAYLRQIMQSHLDHHGDELYEEAKSVRNLVEHAVLVAGQARGSAAPDPVEQLAAAARLLSVKKTPCKRSEPGQRDLFSGL